jgi:ribose 5-phosphate isomerase A
MTTRDHEKLVAARAAVREVEPGMIVGLGTGSSAAHVVALLGERVRTGLDVRGVPTSMATRALAEGAGIPLVTLDDVETVDLAIDGADEIDPQLQLIKGGGGALLHEKIVAAAAHRFVIVGDSGKLVERLGAFPLPVEVIAFGWRHVAQRLASLGATVTQRMSGDAPFVTEEGSYILDCRFATIGDPVSLGPAIRAITGVVEHGLFVGMATKAIIGVGDEVRVIDRDTN